MIKKFDIFNKVSFINYNSTNKLMEKLKKQIQTVVDIYKSGNLKKAELLTKKLINSNPKIVFLYNLLGLILVDQEKNDQAMKSYEEGIKIDPASAMIYNNIGFLLFKNKTESNIKKAEIFYKKAISLDNKLIEAYNNFHVLPLVNFAPLPLLCKFNLFLRLFVYPTYVINLDFL